MANIFLDTNILIDLYERDPAKAKEYTGHKLYISPLSCHILCYTEKVKIPDAKLTQLLTNIGLVDLNSEVLSRSLSGPTNDIEDNLQLHSAVRANCEYFITRDKLLLKMAYFGKTKITSEM